MIEHGMTFSDLVATYGVARSEGVALRYLTDAWRTLQHSLPTEARTEELDDVVVWLGELIKQVDSSLVDEWAQMADPEAPISKEALERARLRRGRPNSTYRQPQGIYHHGAQRHVPPCGAICL